MPQTVQVYFPDGHTNGQKYTVTPAPKDFTINNVVLGEVEPGINGHPGKQVITNTNEDYFIFDPSSDDPTRQNPTIKFKIEDKGLVHQYRWKVCIRPTWWPYEPSVSFPNLPYAYLEGTVAQPGEVTATWDGVRNVGADGMADRDTYAFDIYVWEVYDSAQAASDTNLIDQETLRAPYQLSVGSHYVQINDNLEEDRRVEIGYRLDDTSGLDASELRIDLLDENLDLIPSTPLIGKSVNVEYGPINIHQLTASEEAGGWRTIFVGQDGHGMEQRDHKNRRLVATNKQIFPTPQVMVWVDKDGETDDINPQIIMDAFEHAEVVTNDDGTVVTENDGITPKTKPRTNGGFYVRVQKVSIPNQTPTTALITQAKNLGCTKGVVVFDDSTYGNYTFNLPAFTETGDLGSLETPRRTHFARDRFDTKVAAFPGDSSANHSARRVMAVSNAILHEMGHALGMGKTGSGGDGDESMVNSPFCVMFGTLRVEFASSLGNYNNPIHFGGLPRSPHARPHWNKMRAYLGLAEWTY